MDLHDLIRSHFGCERGNQLIALIQRDVTGEPAAIRAGKAMAALTFRPSQIDLVLADPYPTCVVEKNDAGPGHYPERSIKCLICGFRSFEDARRNVMSGAGLAAIRIANATPWTDVLRNPYEPLLPWEGPGYFTNGPITYSPSLRLESLRNTVIEFEEVHGERVHHEGVQQWRCPLCKKWRDDWQSLCAGCGITRDGGPK